MICQGWITLISCQHSCNGLYWQASQIGENKCHVKTKVKIVKISCVSILDSRANILSKQSSLLSSGSRGSGHESVIIDSHSDSRVSPVYRDINSFRPSLIWSIVTASTIVIERSTLHTRHAACSNNLRVGARRSLGDRRKAVGYTLHL